MDDVVEAPPVMVHPAVMAPLDAPLAWVTDHVPEGPPLVELPHRIRQGMARTGGSSLAAPVSASSINTSMSSARETM